MLSDGEWSPRAQSSFVIAHAAVTWVLVACIMAEQLPVSPLLLLALPVLAAPLVCSRWAYVILCISLSAGVHAAIPEPPTDPTLARLMVGGLLLVTLVACELIHIGMSQMRDLTSEFVFNIRRFRTILEQGMDIVVVLDLDGELLYSSASFPRVLGKDPERPGEPRLLEVHDSDREHVMECWRRSLAAPGEPLAIGFRLQHADGGYVSLEGHVTNFLDHEAIQGILIVVRDVSQRDDARRSLAQRDVLLQSAERLAHVGSWFWDVPSQDVTWSDEAYRIMGVDPHGEKRTARNFVELLLPEDRERVVEAVRAQVETGTGEMLTFRIEDLHGRTRHISMVMQIERDESGEPLRFVGTFYDVSEHKRAEAALARSERRLLEAQRIGRLGNWEIDLETGERWWSKEALRVTCGASIEQPPSFEGLLRDYVHPFDREKLVDTVERCVSGGRPAETSFRVIHADQSERHLHAQIRVDQRREGRAIRLAGTIQDVTNQRIVERELELHRNNLEELVEERTLELEQSRAALARSERLASVGTLAAGMAHQINNPVGAILLAAESALLGAPEQSARRDPMIQALRDIAAQARRCGAIVRSILTFSHSDVVEKTVMDLRETVEEAAQASKSYAEQHAAKLSLEMTERPLRVRMSPIEIEQVLINLVHNAIESRNGGVSVRVRAMRLGDLAVVEVQDDGGGIDPEELEHVFDPFFTTRLEQGGTGLGLSVAHGIASDHGGRLELASQRGEGTRARLTLPICRHEVDFRGDIAS